MTRRTSNEARQSVIAALNDGPARPMTIATATGLSTSVVHRHLLGLKGSGAATKDEDAGTWALTGKVSKVTDAPTVKRRGRPRIENKAAPEPDLDGTDLAGAVVIFMQETIDLVLEELPKSHPLFNRVAARKTILNQLADQ